MKKILAIILALAPLSACAQSYQPIVDTRGGDSSRYQTDLFECRQYAERTSPAEDSLVAGGIGAAAGAGLGAIVGGLAHGVSAGQGALAGAAVGGLLGAGGGAIHGTGEQQRIIDNCLRGRGWNVLN